MRDRGMLDNRYVLVNGSFANLNIDGLLTIDGAADDNIFRLGEVALDLDFTGADFDTKAECEAMGLKFGDSVTYPFPDQLYPGYDTDGAWAHTGGTGWTPTIADIVTGGAAMLIPLVRPGNWQIECTLDYTPDNVNLEGILALGYISNSNHVGACGSLADESAIASEVEAWIETNDGDDTLTNRYTGAVQGVGDIVLGFRSVNGVIEVYDDDDDAWHSYEGHPTTTVSYTAAWAFLQFYNYGGFGSDPWTGVHIKSLTLTYLL